MKFFKKIVIDENFMENEAETIPFDRAVLKLCRTFIVMTGQRYIVVKYDNSDVSDIACGITYDDLTELEFRKINPRQFALTAADKIGMCDTNLIWDCDWVE